MNARRQPPRLAKVGVNGNGNGNGHQRSAKAVILAGGRGTRLAPYTSILPKPLMPIGDRSILETVVDQLGSYGFTDITFCVGYLSHLIRAVFETRAHNGVDITYVQEADALGTAAPLRLVEGLDDTFVMMNGDVLTTLDYTDLVRHHEEAGNILTVATRRQRIKIDYGVIHVSDDSKDGFGVIESWEEKPEIVSTVSMGIYVIEPTALSYIPDEGAFDLPDLVRTLVAADQQVGVFNHEGLWFDIGRHEDYDEAVATWFASDSATAGAEEASTNGRANGHGANGHAGNGRTNGHSPNGKATASLPTMNGYARLRRAAAGKLVR